MNFKTNPSPSPRRPISAWEDCERTSGAEPTYRACSLRRNGLGPARGQPEGRKRPDRMPGFGTVGRIPGRAGGLIFPSDRRDGVAPYGGGIHLFPGFGLRRNPDAPSDPQRNRLAPGRGRVRDGSDQGPARPERLWKDVWPALQAHDLPERRRLADLHSAILMSKAILTAGLAREEIPGSFIRRDFPTRIISCGEKTPAYVRSGDQGDLQAALCRSWGG